MPPKPPEAALISIPEASRRLGIDARRVRAAIKRKQIPSVEIGSRKLIPATVLERLVHPECA